MIINVKTSEKQEKTKIVSNDLYIHSSLQMFIQVR